MNKKQIITTSIIGIIALGVGFYGGASYAKNNTPQNVQAGRFQQGGGMGGNRNMRGGNGFVSGDIISKDDRSITVKMRDGGSKIIFMSGSTSILKSTTGSTTDLANNEQVTVTGTQNPDGSVNAQSIQIRPAQPNTTPSQLQQ